MIGIVLVTHGSLATSFLSALEHIVGKQQQIIPICIEANDDMGMHREKIVESAAAVNSGQGVVILTDMFGGTPSNLALAAIADNVEVLAGVNLPMLVKLASIRKDIPLKEAVNAAQEAGRKYINVASQLLLG